MGTILGEREAAGSLDVGEVVEESTPLSRFLAGGGTTGAPATRRYLRIANQVAGIIGADDISETAVVEHIRRMKEERHPWELQLRQTLRDERSPQLQEALKPHYQTQVPERLRERTTHAWMDVVGPKLVQAELAASVAVASAVPAA